MGSRFGGSKQTVPVDEQGDRIIDLSMYDARRAGFDKVIFIIKEEMYESFREDIGRSAERFFDVSYVFQKTDRAWEGGPAVEVPAGRGKPFGTGQAVLAAKPVTDCPFCVINADDFYGREPFEKLHAFLAGDRPAGSYAMAGYELGKTVTENGSVARGVCEVDPDGYLAGIVERTKIVCRDGGIAYTEDGEHFVPLSEDDTVSMNFWGFGPEFMDVLADGFSRFLNEDLPLDPLKKEFYLPSAAQQAMQEGALVKVIRTSAVWYGMTYREDLDTVKKAVAAMKRDGIYPDDLWA